VNTAQHAVERAILTMWRRYHEPLSLTELADTAILSKFYFSRVFRSVTGTSPVRFLTAVRLAKAKRLLLETSLSVTDIAYGVGYNSLGTFTSRFTRSVGASPAKYRMLSDVGIPAISSPFALANPLRFGTVTGKVTLPTTDVPVRVYIGAFNSPVVEGMPTSCDILDSSGFYELPRLPEGEWFIRAAAVAVRNVDPRPWLRTPLYVGSSRPVIVRGNSSFDIDLAMRRFTSLDLPVLLALPELDSRHLPELVPVAG
jgi:AraC family transcriptional regulator